ncbi:hypothetical protein GOEFS_035_00300 [Gordonia effusa NBRC 100432]|uniref:Coenzyme Q-binding protein COQ10 START domain-containing protein n=1 Tax=Gordonia effusa NBRC 100432 TaxID=1077974 RepID=H0QXE7_9ACTN|nr:hypothetical protein [Gordonia effusa]GAB17498.1 hypothetical protein GOEFS_035_00300 [Gordonia effusa NBRC 100432]
MITSHHELMLPASVAATMEILRDIEGLDRWLRPHLPTWPTIRTETSILERTADGAPALVRTRTSALGIKDDALAHYEWTETGCTTSIVRSNVLRSSVSVFDVGERDGGTLLSTRLSAELKIKLPWLIERKFEDLQQTFTAAVQRALLAEATRRAGR